MKLTVPTMLRRLVALFTLLALLSMPLQAFAAKGSTLAAEADTLTPLAGTGGLLAFQVSFANTGRSNISGLRFEGTSTGGATFNGTHSSSACQSAAGGAGVLCQLGSLAAGAPAVQLLLVFNAPASPGTVAFNGSFLAEAKNGTPGAKQDTWPIPQQNVQVLDSGDPNFYSDLLVDGGASGTPSVGLGQTIVVNTPGVNKAYGLSVLQHSNAVSCAARNYVGQTVDVNVANGQAAVTVVITFAPTPGLTPSKVGIVHDCEPVPTDCVASPGYCMTAEWASGTGPNRVQVTVQLPNNGSFKGFY